MPGSFAPQLFLSPWSPLEPGLFTAQKSQSNVYLISHWIKTCHSNAFLTGLKSHQKADLIEYANCPSNKNVPFHKLFVYKCIEFVICKKYLMGNPNKIVQLSVDFTKIDSAILVYYTRNAVFNQKQL